VIINKSTVPVGSTRVVSDALGRDDVHVVSNPEFLREGHAVSDFLNPERVVVGADDEGVAFRVAALHLRLSAPLLVTDPASAELIKYASNAFLALKLSYVNAIAAVAEAVDADIDDVVKGLGLDSRVGARFLQPGPGWGGSCLPKDTSALIRIAEDAHYDFTLLKDVVSVNRQQFERVVRKTEEVLRGPVAGRRIAVWGLTFKAHTDDLRDSPAIEIVERLIGAGAAVVAYDPEVDKGADVVDGLEVAGDAYAACQGADALVVLTEWPEFGRTDLDRVADALVAPRIVDTRNVVDRLALERRGFVYRGIGRA
jgi:UDPglucose 6-dehydrogenase